MWNGKSAHVLRSTDSFTLNFQVYARGRNVARIPVSDNERGVLIVFQSDDVKTLAGECESNGARRTERDLA